MTKFKIQESETARIKVFADYVRKLGAVYPLNDKQTFELEGTKLNIYAEGKTAQGGNGVAQIAIDVEDVTVDTSISAHFVTSINSLIVLLNKVKKGKVVISYDDKQLVVSEDGGRGKFKLTLFITCDQDELDETKNFISDQMATPEFQSPLKVDVKANYRRFANLSTMTRVLTISDVIESKIDGSAIKFADNLIILKYSDGQNTGVPEVFIEEKMLQLLKDVSSIESCADIDRKPLFQVIQYLILLKHAVKPGQLPFCQSICSLYQTISPFRSRNFSSSVRIPEKLNHGRILGEIQVQPILWLVTLLSYFIVYII